MHAPHAKSCSVLYVTNLFPLTEIVVLLEEALVVWDAVLAVDEAVCRSQLASVIAVLAQPFQDI